MKKANNAELAKALYEYDLEQNIKKIERGEGIFNYGYDNLYRLTTADSPEGYAANDESFEYDSVGNRISRTENGTSESQNYNQKNQLQSIDSSDDTQDTTYTYNANGHTKTQTTNGVTTEYRYNHEERLIEVKRDDTTIAEYAYNLHGQRVKKTVNGVTTWYLYNGNGLAAEYSSTGQLIKEYHFHPQKTWMTDPLFQRTAMGELYYYHNDHLDTPQQMLDDAGNIVWDAQYSAFGKAHITIDTVENNLRFPGQYFDDETGLHHNYFRDYDSALGRYIQSDPIGLRGGINTFSYAEGHPLSLLDPLGLMSIGHKPDMALLPGCEKIVLSDKSKNMNKIITGDPYIYKSKLLFAAAFPIPGGKKAAISIFLEHWIQVSYHYSINIEDVTYVIKCKEVDECGVEKVVEHSGYHYSEHQTRLPDIVKKWTEYNMKHESTMGPKK
ncbi:RHS repeat domain-containing protein [Cellvibrio japonicus]|uniref:RHS repeat domain-containing protein n=1 Tax=Cellvibrio japonicus TaxID=155077 RepID=UPI0002F74022|nr:RHS repeat-associated core domain-containing protein [Cellvibrio japonicus]QEI10780.1 hypothetical protein FY117_00090 [Cellvibrio japonicus]QEI14356.1 hypothetical protein FY116_00090 [Cellvibrio japonicus]QEI17934.1 hypothetical protein FY115_00090 [Cellvibrio japonicus]